MAGCAAVAKTAEQPEGGGGGADRASLNGRAVGMPPRPGHFSKKKGPLTNGSTKFGPMFHRNRRGNKHAVAT
jgi:hypothetical protein